tara:strand:+ start:290 stop:589 length:300 start_codon:yes stop_codon:yes gene_type:complete
MATLQHNVTGETTTELISAGSNVNVSKISLANVEGSNSVSIDLFITKENTGSYYFFKQLDLPTDSAFVYDINYNVKDFTLFVKLTKSASETPAVDIILF